MLWGSLTLTGQFTQTTSCGLLTRYTAALILPLDREGFQRQLFFSPSHP
jgi:hypothetical protein